MSLFIICEIIFLDITFIVNFIFLNKEIKSYYNEMLYYLIQLYNNLELFIFRVIVIDQDLALIKVINDYLSK
jgi:hypothetical protein